MAIPEYANEAGAPAVQAVGCPQCGVRRGERCIVKAGFAGTRPAPRLHTKRVKDYLNNASSSPVEPEAFPPSSGSTIDDGIIVGDCLSVMAEMPDGSVDLAITSPPYNALNSSGGGWKNCRGKWEAASDGIYDVHDDAMPVDEYIEWQRNCLAEMMRVVSEDGAIFYFHRRRVQQDVQEDHAADILEIAPAFGFAVRQTIIWARAGGFNSNPGYLLPSQEQIYLLAKPGRFRHDGLGGIPDVFHLPAVSAPRGTDLPPQFPVEIPRTLLAAIRPEPRRAGAYGLALDPFGGSGTVAEAAVLEGWDYIHIDISPAYCAYARQRVAAVMATSDDTPQSDTPQSTDTPQSDTPQQEPAPWANSLPLWNATDKAVYNHIQAAQGGHLQSVPLVQADIAAAIGKKERTVSTSVNKLKAHRCISVYSARKGASLYSTTSEIPRWPAKVAGGIGSGPVDTPQSTDTPQSDTPQSTDTPQSDTPQFLPLRPPGPGGGGDYVNDPNFIIQAITHPLSRPGSPGPQIAEYQTAEYSADVTIGTGQPSTRTADRPGGPACPRCGQGMAESPLLRNRGYPGAYICAGQDRTCSRLYYAPLDVEVFPAGLRWDGWTRDCIAAVRQLVPTVPTPLRDSYDDSHVRDYRALFGGAWPWETHLPSPEEYPNA